MVPEKLRAGLLGVERGAVGAEWRLWAVFGRVWFGSVMLGRLPLGCAWLKRLQLPVCAPRAAGAFK